MAEKFPFTGWNPLVAALLGPDGDPLGVQMLRGFLGPFRDDDEHVVLFEDPELADGKVVAIADIKLHLRFPQGDSSPLEVDALWIDSAANPADFVRQNAVERPGGGGPGGPDTYRPHRW
jgi:hypothetical protein